MIRIGALAVSVILAGTGQLTSPQNASVRVLYTPFRTSCWHRLDTFELNALCNFERDAKDPAMRRVWEIVSNAPETSDRSATFDDQLVRLQLVHRGLNQDHWVDQRGRVRVAPNKPARQLSNVALAELENALIEMCPRLKRQKEAREAAVRRTKAPAGKAK